MFCSQCGQKNPDNAEYCRNCGKKLPDIIEKDKKNSKDDIQDHLSPASQGRRFANYIIDTIGVYVFAFICGVGFYYIGLISDYTSESSYTILGWFLYFLYYLITESLWQKSIAKFITKTKVVTECGGVPEAKHIIKRSLVRLIPFDAFSFLSQYPVGWHDKWSGTRVIVDKK
jgi:uncharacterized RDD family membrane protein YckC/ribosomal protein L40E